MQRGGGGYQLPGGREGAQRERDVNETMKNENKKVSFRHDMVDRI